MRNLCLLLLIVPFLFVSCCDCKTDERKADEDVVDVIDADTTVDSKNKCYVERVDTNGLIILFPNYYRIDLVCGVTPPKYDESVILIAAASYTGKRKDEFEHLNIAGYHVSNGVKYPGYKETSNTGAFAYYENKWKFCYDNYAPELDSAAAHHGAAFAQEMLIHEAEIKHTQKSDGNVNVFRALCELDGRLCVIESKASVKFGDFKSSLRQIGVTEALYLDMGGWNHAWYRPTSDTIVELHPKNHDYYTNWITFFK